MNLFKMVVLTGNDYKDYRVATYKCFSMTGVFRKGFGLIGLFLNKFICMSVCQSVIGKNLLL